MAQLISFATSVHIQQQIMHCYPEPVIGYVKDDHFFTLPQQDLLSAGLVAKAHNADALIYSKPSLFAQPEMSEMKIQNQAGIAFGIIGGTRDDASQVFFWGGKTPLEPILGRQFVHGIWDCYSCIRDTFAMGKQKLKEEGINDWPFNPITLPDVPRSDNWWNDGLNLYEDWIKPAGFTAINKEDARPGDGFLLKIRSHHLNHAGLVIADNQILHHLPTRLSRRENAGVWNYQAQIWVRYTGPK